MHGPREIYTTWPDADSAQAAAGIAVTEGLCACANLLPGMTSGDRWQGAIEAAAEGVALFNRQLFERGKQVVRHLLLGAVATIERMTAHVVGLLAPGGQHVIESPDGSAPAPQRQQRGRYAGEAQIKPIPATQLLLPESPVRRGPTDRVGARGQVEHREHDDQHERDDDRQRASIKAASGDRVKLFAGDRDGR